MDAVVTIKFGEYHNSVNVVGIAADIIKALPLLRKAVELCAMSIDEQQKIGVGNEN